MALTNPGGSVKCAVHHVVAFIHSFIDCVARGRWNVQAVYERTLENRLELQYCVANHDLTSKVIEREMRDPRHREKPRQMRFA